MIDPDYGTISDVDPDGGSDYSTLQGWYEDTYGETEIQHARCHHGDAAGLGELDTSTQSWAYTPTADQPVCIYAADGDEADGSKDDQLQGAAIVCSASAGIDTSLEAVRIAALRFTVTANFLAAAACVDNDSAIIERCTVMLGSFPSLTGFVVASTTAGGTVAATTRNNLILNLDSTRTAEAIAYIAVSGSATLNATCYANSVVNCADTAPGGGLGAQAGAVGDEVKIVARNNVVVDDGTPAGDSFGEAGSGTVDWTGSSHNVSSDATAKGSDALINKAIGDVWADVGDDDAPFAPKVDGDLDPPNGVNLYAAGVVEDSLGAERPTQGAHYRGGREIFAGLYKAYGGPTPSAVDYGVMLASVRAGTASMDIAGLGLAAGGPPWAGWLAVRATSAAGIEETNTDRITRAVVDEAGDLQPLPLAAVWELTAELQTDESVIVGFTHTTLPGWETPTEFEVLTDNGTGELNLTTPAAVIAVTDPGAGDYEAAVAASTLPAKFSARARAGTETGPVAPPVTVSMSGGPTAVEET